MASLSIQARIDSDVWASIKRADESNTEALQRIAAHYIATGSDNLQTLTNQPTAETAIAALTTVFRLHQTLMQNTALATPSQPAMPTFANTAQPVEPPKTSKFADDDF
jgi:hypothetical protein